MPNDNSVTRKFLFSVILVNGNEEKLQFGRKKSYGECEFEQTEIRLHDYSVKLKLRKM